MTARPKVIGLTGGIGCGKSTVAAMLADLGAVVIDADVIGHETYRPGSDGWRRVTEAFGPDIVGPDQTIDRKKLGAIVFTDPEALRRLNAIVHPLIFDEIRRRIEALRQTRPPRLIVVEAAVLIEANWFSLVDEVWIVTTSRHAVIQRLAEQRGMAPDAVGRRVEAQLGDAERRAVADVVIENTGSMESLRSEVEAQWRRVVGTNGGAC
jgi:dephospho-CoA kinase